MGLNSTKWLMMAAALATGGASAQPMPPGGMPHGESMRHEERQGDRRDLRQAEEQLRRFEEARSRNDFRALKTMDGQVLASLDNDIRENNREASDAHRQARMERGPGRHDLDERAKELDRIVRQEKDLRSKYARLSGRVDPRSLDRKHDLLQQIVTLSQEQLRLQRH